MQYKVLIPSAGLGSRLGNLSKNINKSLLTINDKPSISYIIEKFSKNIEIIIAVGYKSKTLKEFLNIAYADRKITVVDIDKFEGPGSGLGYSILKCKDYLQTPFIFCSNDTIVIEDIPEPYMNWMGYDEVYDNTKYRSLDINDNNVRGINEKGYKFRSPAYIGLCGIFNYKEFWNTLENDINYGSISIGESHGFQNLFSLGVKPIKFKWYDTGSQEGLDKSRNYFKNKDRNILPKENESIWFIEDKVIKFSIDENFIKERVERVKKSETPLFPKIISSNDNMYSYRYVVGKTLSKCITVPIFKKLLDELKNYWKIKNLSDTEKLHFKQKCYDFYKIKTYKRLEDYCIKYDYIDKKDIINDIDTPSIIELLEKVNWDNLSNGIASLYHGDLHFENIILTENDDFLLLDWRQNFAGIIEYGDVYYDLAKLLHGLIVSHEIINKDLYFINDDNNIYVDIYRNNIYTECEKVFWDFVKKENYDIKKIKILTALIYINIASLHHYPYSKFLYFFGKYMLNNVLDDRY